MMEKLLLHVCCAPCSGAIIEALDKEGVKPVVFFSNSNIVPREEYDLRLAECRRYCEKFGIEVIEDDYDHEAWLASVKGLEAEPERGRRCSVCFEYRLRRAAAYAQAHGFRWLTTTLASSRWKNIIQINAAGQRAVADFPQVTFWEQNWRRGGLQERRGQLLRLNQFYNQQYCGCEFSFRLTEKALESN